MSRTEQKTRILPEVMGALTNPEKRLAEALGRAKELVEEHPKFAIGAAVAGAFLFYELYEHGYKERAGGELPEGFKFTPVTMLRDIANRIESDPEGIKGEAHKAIEGVGNYIKGHKPLAIAVAFGAPLILEHFFPRSEAKAQKAAALTPTAPIRPRR